PPPPPPPPPPQFFQEEDGLPDAPSRVVGWEICLRDRDSAFGGEKQQKPKAAKKDARKAKKPSTKTQKIAAATKAKRAAKKLQAE
ncbi:hypothetical protein, partial [Enterobacter intestinihominis]